MDGCCLAAWLAVGLFGLGLGLGRGLGLGLGRGCGPSHTQASQ